MNLWGCDEPGCKSTAVGIGPATGLRAIGWYVQIFDIPDRPHVNSSAFVFVIPRPPWLLCPAHAEAHGVEDPRAAP